MEKETDPAYLRTTPSPRLPFPSGRSAPLLAAGSLFLILLCLACPAQSAPSQPEGIADADSASTLDLTPEETAHLKHAGRITMCVDPKWPPFEYLDEAHVHQGMAADYFRLFAKRIGTPVTVIPTESWTQSTDFLKQGKMRRALHAQPDSRAFRLSRFHRTLPDLSLGGGGPEDASYINGLDALSGKTMAMVPGYRLDEAVRRDHPDVELVPVSSTEEALTAVSRGKAYATACSLVEAAYLIRTMGLGNLKVAGHTKYDDQFRVGVAKGKPELLGIMSKAVESLTPREKKPHRRPLDFRALRDRRISAHLRILAIVGLGALLTDFWLVGIARNNKRLAALNAQLRNTKRELELKNSELEQISRTDRLTRLANRGRIDECLQQEVHRALRYDMRFSLILADLDHFKAINDTLGHHAGDEVPGPILPHPQAPYPAHGHLRAMGRRGIFDHLPGRG